MTLVIATLSREWGQEGVQTHFNELRRFLQRKGGEVRFVNPFAGPSLLIGPTFAIRHLLASVSGPADVWWYRNFHYLFLRRALRRQLSDGRPWLVYAQCPLSAKAALEARVSATQKVVLAVHYNGSQADEWILKGMLGADSAIVRRIREIESTVPVQVDGLVVFSEFMRRAVLSAAPAAAKVPLHITGQFIEPSEEVAVGPERDLISIGSLEPRKNQQYLLRVLAEAKRLGHEYTLTIVGGGPARRSLAKLARSLNVAEQVDLLGFQPRAARWLRLHRALVHSSLIESFGAVLIEAMAAARPIVAAPVGAIPEVFDDGVEGRYWPLDDPRTGAEILIELLESPQAYARSAAAARERFERCYDAERLAPPLTEFLSTIAAD